MEELSRYSVDELRRMRGLVEKEMERRREDYLRQALREVEQIAERYGFALSDLVDDIEVQHSHQQHCQQPNSRQ
ncbi:hypothetical protein [Halorhodospira halochloris]|uniref:hypothetical protein n=1 Tax=Halorhodospira halochloris TaxID=1052 RepID=UPI001EE79D99|nr:hypothetical protein [Halorhodospira halochloris]MCG5548451.1 hypothetical protein [Halorhodospira halochloris]